MFNAYFLSANGNSEASVKKFEEFEKIVRETMDERQSELLYKQVFKFLVEAIENKDLILENSTQNEYSAFYDTIRYPANEKKFLELCLNGEDSYPGFINFASTICKDMPQEKSTQFFKLSAMAYESNYKLNYVENSSKDKVINELLESFKFLEKIEKIQADVYGLSLATGWNECQTVPPWALLNEKKLYLCAIDSIFNPDLQHSDMDSNDTKKNADRARVQAQKKM